MKNLKLLRSAFTATSCLLLFAFNSTAQNIGINTTGADPDPSALLDLSSPDKGFLVTRADTADIASPAFGLMTLSPKDSCLYMNNGKGVGKTWFNLFGAGVTCGPVVSVETEFPCGGTEIPIVDVTSPTGKVWMDRNLGASQVATSVSDAAAYGDLYQWGRCSDGHEKRTSGKTGTRSTTNAPSHGDFISLSGTNPDWLNPSDNNLWQGVEGVNNPCPNGYRIPTYAEWGAEVDTWGSKTVAGAFASPLKLTTGGYRYHDHADIIHDNSGATAYMYYWSSTTVTTTLSNYLYIKDVYTYHHYAKANAASVRCIKD